MSDKNDYVNHMHASCQPFDRYSGSPFQSQIQAGMGGNLGVNEHVGPASSFTSLKFLVL